MGVGLKGVLLTSHIYPCTQSMVPYSGDKEFRLAWDDPGGSIGPRSRQVLQSACADAW